MIYHSSEYYKIGDLATSTEQRNKPTVALIAAVSANCVIGKDGKLCWHLPRDLKRFHTLTKNNIVVMGRKTFESIDCNPLPNRVNVVATRQTHSFKNAEQVVTIDSVSGFCNAMRDFDIKGKTIFIAGGSGVYEDALIHDLVDIIYLTRVNAEYDGDTYFPKIDFSQIGSWEMMEYELYNFGGCDNENEPSYSFETYKRNREPIPEAN